MTIAYEKIRSYLLIRFVKLKFIIINNIYLSFNYRNLFLVVIFIIPIVRKLLKFLGAIKIYNSIHFAVLKCLFVSLSLVSIISASFRIEELLFNTFCTGNIYAHYFFKCADLLLMIYSIFVVFLYALMDFVKLTGIACNELVSENWIKGRWIKERKKIIEKYRDIEKDKNRYK